MKITVYTIPDCPFCKQEKDYLNAKGLPFEEKDVQADKDALSEMLDKSQKFAGVPFTMIDDIALKGFTPSEFDAAIAKASGASMPTADVAAPSAPSVPAEPKDMSTAPVGPLGEAIDKTPDPMPVAPTMPQADKPDMTMKLDDMPLAGGMPKPAMGDLGMPSVPATSTPEPVVPDMSSAMPAAPVVNSQPLGGATSDPQVELNSILQDLQTKVGDQSADSVAPSMPVSPAMPVVPTMPAGDTAPSPVPPAVPDFNNQ